MCDDEKSNYSIKPDESLPSRSSATMTASTIRPFDVRDPIGTPSWKEVPTIQQRHLPYGAVGRVRVLRDGFEIERGTCWLVGNNTAITAAHVVELWGNPMVSVSVDIPGESSSVVLDVSIPTNYGKNLAPYDPWDIALLRFVPRARLWLARGVPESSAVRLVGFPFIDPSTMVESQGATVIPDTVLLLHRSDTVGGHSGAPVLHESGAWATGIHISGFNGNPYKNQYPRYNIALLLRQEINLIIEEHLTAWG